MKEELHLTAVPLYAANRLRLVSTWQTLSTLWRMFLDRGLPRKKSDLKRQSQSLPTSPPDTMLLPQAQASRLGGHVGTLLGFVSEGKTKAVRKKNKTDFMLFHQTDWTP
ncbi:hypothetical protein CgunFtcFv8_026918 [Champsocephalus gunnari]|uniref:Uncharacterized protein n=1 Tax=Champsocephalus gunnari TaxID=52237 RepID=A0AAN8DWN8_CHAGU|nr:hypothetical protein CgunFtcFv8_026918 [Champsocephalus gunnari]